MKIKMTDGRGVFVEGKKRELDEEIVVVKEEGQLIIDLGFAVEIKPKKSKKADD